MTGSRDDQIIHVSRERFVLAKNAQCECHDPYCNDHSGVCGQEVEKGWKIRLRPPRKELGELGEMTVREFEDLVESSDTLCAACARRCPNQLFDPARKC